MEFLTEGHHLIINTGTRAGRPNLRVDVIGHIQHSGSFGEFQQVALGGEHVYLVVIEVHLKLIHRLHTTRILKHLAYSVQPVIHTAFRRFHTFVAPVGSHTSFGYLVHTLRTNLYLYPFLLWAQYGDVQTLVAV